MNPIQKTESPLRVLAFLGPDIAGSGEDLLRAHHAEGFSLLALDASAILKATEAKTPFTVLDDWVSPSCLELLRREAARCERSWYEAGREHFTWKGVCWPEYDRRALSWFWRDSLLAQRLAEVFKEHGLEELRFFAAPNLRPAVFCFRSDVWGAVWRLLLGSKAVSLPCTPAPCARRLKAHLADLYYRARSTGKRLAARLPGLNRLGLNRVYAPERLAGKTVLAIHAGEYSRFTHVVEELKTHRPGTAGAVIFPASEEIARRIEREWKIPVLLSPRPWETEPTLPERFLRGLESARAAAHGTPWENILHLDFQFRYLCETRWPTLAAWLENWSRLWDRSRPELVFVTTLDDPESQLPAAAANHYGIPTVALPHAGIAIGENTHSCKMVLYGLPLQKKFLAGAGVAPEMLFSCRGLLAENEYPVVEQRLATLSKEWRVLALTQPCAHPGAIMPGRVTFDMQLRGLRALVDPPSDIADRLAVRIRVHPHFPELDLVAAADERLRSMVLPLELPLGEALKNTDLVVALNYFHTALLHAVMMGKPILFFSTLPPEAPYPHDAGFVAVVGDVVGSRDEFWSAIRDFFTNPERQERMRNKERSFAKEELDDSRYPHIGDVVESIISRRKS